MEGRFWQRKGGMDMRPRLTPVHGMRHRTYWGEKYGDKGDQRCEIDPDSEQGLFAEDTRFVSFYQIYLN